MVKMKKVLSPRGGPAVYVGAASRTEMGEYKGRLERLLEENKIETGRKGVHVDVSWTRRSSPRKEEERIVIVVIDTGDEIDIIIYVDPNSDPDPGGW